MRGSMREKLIVCREKCFLTCTFKWQLPSSSAVWKWVKGRLRKDRNRSSSLSFSDLLSFSFLTSTFNLFCTAEDVSCCLQNFHLPAVLYSRVSGIHFLYFHIWSYCICMLQIPIFSAVWMILQCTVHHSTHCVLETYFCCFLMLPFVGLLVKSAIIRISNLKMHTRNTWNDTTSISVGKAQARCCLVSFVHNWDFTFTC